MLLRIILKAILGISASNIFLADENYFTNAENDNSDKPHLPNNDVCYNRESCSEDLETRYLFYDVNPSEGFNLRRDVYMRFAVLAHEMERAENPALRKFELVLPPWSHLVHWRYSDRPEQIPWGLYFDLDSLRLFAPVIEMHEFFSRYPTRFSKVKIDEVYTLQHFKDMFETGNYKDRWKVDECERKEYIPFFFYENMTAQSFHCLSYHGPATKLNELFVQSPAKYILIHHAEVALHDYFGGRQYWRARRSMRFSKELRDIAAQYRKRHLRSSDREDNTTLPKKWTDETLGRTAIGGPYIGVHLRRKDFVRSRASETPSLERVAKQVERILEKLLLNTVFIATDGSQEEMKILSKLLRKYDVKKYEAPDDVQRRYGDGGVAIIDQIICSHARYFIGTHESTFSFRIQEEREILGFPVETTFNVLCKGDMECPKPSVWKIEY